MKTLIILIFFLVGCSNTKVIDKYKEEDNSEIFDCVLDKKIDRLVCYTQKRVENA